jgi:penicillin-binding protein 1C
VSDIPTRVGSYSPENITRNYLGVVPANEALARSLNVPAVRSLRVFGVDRFARLLRSLGLTTLFRPGNEYGLPLILGGAEVTLQEITGLYAGLGRTANDGFFAPLISRGAAWLTLDALCFVVRPGEEAHWQEYAGARRIAWKTGTSYGFRDAWAVGVTPDWTVGVWIGNATGEGRAELRSAITSAPVLFELFSALNPAEGETGAWFSQPASDLREQEVCAFSGYPPGPNCRTFKTAALPRSASAHQPCPFCKTVTLNETADRRVSLENSGGDRVIQQKWFVLPPAEEWYYRRWNLDYKPLPPPETQDGAGSGQSFPLALFNPEAGSQVFVPRERDGREGRIVFSAAHREENSLIHWHLDAGYLGFTTVFHEMEARPPPGPHTLTLVDGAGNTLTRSFKVLDNAD